jgi:hypothetical protein
LGVALAPLNPPLRSRSNFDHGDEFIGVKRAPPFPFTFLPKKTRDNYFELRGSASIVFPNAGPDATAIGKMGGGEFCSTLFVLVFVFIS